MALITRSDIEAVFGVESVRVWSNLTDATGDAAVDDDRVDTAIANAEYDVLARFTGSAYNVANASNVKLTDWRAKLAGVWLFENRRAREGEGGDTEMGIAGHKRAVNDEINLYLCGARRFPDLQTTYATPLAPHIAMPPAGRGMESMWP